MNEPMAFGSLNRRFAETETRSILDRDGLGLRWVKEPPSLKKKIL